MENGEIRGGWRKKKTKVMEYKVAALLAFSRGVPFVM